MEKDVAPSSGYRLVVDDFEHRQSSVRDSARWVPISERIDQSDFDAGVWKKLAVDAAYDQKWGSLLLNKGPIEIALYPMLIAELRPATILEFGALHGGSAVWMADICQALRVKSNIVSVDIDLSLLSTDAQSDSRIKFIEGDVNKIEEIDDLSILSTLPHPWLVIDDCHQNTEGILSFISSAGAALGDYIIVEDTNLDAWDAWGERWMDQKRVLNGKQKIVRMRNWMTDNLAWKVDTKYVDFFGYNASKNWNSVLRKCED